MNCQVVITGVGAVTSLGVGARTLHTRWQAGACGIRDGEAAADFEPAAHLSAKELRRNDRFAQLALVAGDEALVEAGWAEGLPCERSRLGVVLGSGVGGIATIATGIEALNTRGADRVSPLSIPMMMSNAATAALAIRYDLHGPSFTVNAACAASAHAIGVAARMIAAGDADAVVTGGSEAALTALSRAGFGAVGALSPTGISLPFDARRNGFVMGEGAAVLVLESAELAAARGAKPLAYLRGYGASSDALHITAPTVDGAGAASAIRLALADAGLAPEDVDYVNAHGSATQLNDRAETQAIKTALGAQAHRVPVSSTKSAIGHLLGAAGAVEAVATVLALRDRVAPPTIGWKEREEGLDLDYVPLPHPLPSNDKPAIGLSNSFGFGGHNAVICLQAT